MQWAVLGERVMPDLTQLDILHHRKSRITYIMRDFHISTLGFGSHSISINAHRKGLL